MKATVATSGTLPASSAAALMPDPILEIRADGGNRTGFGHVGRCLALAHALSGRSLFRVHDQRVAAFVEAGGGQLAGSGSTAPVVLLDQVAPTSLGTVRSLQAAGRRVALLDDFGGGRAQADLVIDPPTGSRWPPAGGLRLAGFEHVLLRDAVLKTRRAEAAGGILVGMGGSDPQGLTVPLSRALADAGLRVAAGLGPGYSGQRPPDAIRRVEPDAFLETLASARALVTAYGHTLLEAAYLGVPAVAVVLRPDQVSHALAFGDHGTAVVLDGSHGVRVEDVVAAVVSLLNDPQRYGAMAERGSALVDGRGAQRVARAIEKLA